MLNRTLITGLICLYAGAFLFAQVEITYPSNYIVIQRNTQNEGTVFIAGKLSQQADLVEARFLRISGEPGESSENWTVIDNQIVNNGFLGQVQVRGGRYQLEVRAVRNGQPVGNPAVVEKVGVGEVYLIVGHSNASSGGGFPAQSSLVISMDPNSDVEMHNRYLNTADPADLPNEFSPLTQGHGISPFTSEPWFWAQFGDKVVQKLNVPVLIYQCAFGGSNMMQTAKSARGEYFEHGFIRADLRMPYINIENTLFQLVPKTGLRAVLSAHGINDAGELEQSQFYDNHKAVIDSTRSRSTESNLTWMIANSCYNSGVIDFLNSEQDRLMLLNNVFRGPNLNSIDNSGRTDGLHFNELGREMAAELWSNSVSETGFLQNSLPIMPQAPDEPMGTLPVNLVEFKASETETGEIQLFWTTVGEIGNRHFEVQSANNGKDFMSLGIVEGAGNSEAAIRYQYLARGPFFTGTNYFRLKQVDLDGTHSFSKIIGVKPAVRNINAFYPNPSGGLFELHTSRAPKSVRISRLDGTLLLEVRNTTRIDLTNLPASVYLAEIEEDDGLKMVQKIVKW